MCFVQGRLVLVMWMVMDMGDVCGSGEFEDFSWKGVVSFYNVCSVLQQVGIDMTQSPFV